MAYHPFERICSLWLERVKHHFVIENLPIRYDRRKRTKYSPTTATSDFDLISYCLDDPKTINLCECKSNINQTFHNLSRDRLLRQLDDLKKHVKKLPFHTKIRKIRRWVFGIKIAKRIRDKVPRDVQIIEGQQFEEVLDELIMLVGKDPKIDPKDDVLSIIRLFWHFGILNENFYRKRAKEILQVSPNLSAKKLKDQLGLITYKTNFAKELLKKLRDSAGL